jgi:general secretion pathway protein E
VPEGERIVLRLLNRESALLPLADLGMPGDVLRAFRGALAAQQGVVLLTGPTGSGKTTTLYAALRELDTAHTNVLTIEDPVEYQLPAVGQIQVRPKIGLTFAQGLRHILRQDPDVILVGETRDIETAEIMIRASLTGHLVFTTLHTSDALGAVLRLLDMGIEPYLLSASLNASVAQRLVRRLCPACRRPSVFTAEERRILGASADALPDGALWRAEGCDACLGGYLGRTGVYELVPVTEGLREAVRSGAPVSALREAAREAGARTLWDGAMDLVAGGMTTLDEVLRTVGTGSPGAHV